MRYKTARPLFQCMASTTRTICFTIPKRLATENGSEVDMLNVPFQATAPAIFDDDDHLYCGSPAAEGLRT